MLMAFAQIHCYCEGQFQHRSEQTRPDHRLVDREPQMKLLVTVVFERCVLAAHVKRPLTQINSCGEAFVLFLRF